MGPLHGLWEGRKEKEGEGKGREGRGRGPVLAANSDDHPFALPSPLGKGRTGKGREGQGREGRGRE